MNPMMLVHFKETFPFRVMEWTMAVLMIGWGLVLFHPAYDANAAPWGQTLFSGMFTRTSFGVACLTVGTLRFAALFVNGMWWRTPFIRLVMAFAANFLWLNIVFGLFAYDTVTTGWAVYPLFVVVELYNAFRAAHDSRLSWTAVSGVMSHGRSG